MCLREIIMNPARLAALVGDVVEGTRPTIIPEATMPQGSQEWLAWRRSGVTATDMAVVMNGRHYGKTVHDLWEEKIGLRNPEPISPALQAAFDRGHRDEPVIRSLARYEKEATFEPCCAQAAKVPFLKGSLDGLGERGGFPLILECKSLSQGSLDRIRGNKLADNQLLGYQSQVKYLMALCQVKVAYIYLCTSSPEGKLVDGTSVTITMEPAEACRIIEAAVRFYACCLYKEDPDTSPLMQGFRVLEAPAPVASMTAPAAAPAPESVPAPAPAPAPQPAAETPAPAPAAPVPASDEPREFRDAGEELVYLSQQISIMSDRKKALIEECLKSGNTSFPTGEVKTSVVKGSIDYAKLISRLVEDFHLDIPDTLIESYRKPNQQRKTFNEKKSKAD